MKRIAVYCGSRDGAKPIFKREAKTLGTALAKEKLGLVYGGATVGLMGELANAVMASGGEVIGVMPEVLIAREITAHHITKVIETSSMHERKQQMIDLADGFIAMPGGPGTMEEWFEVVTWAKIGLHKKPIGLLNTDGFYDGLIQFLATMEENGFLSAKERSQLIIEHTSERLIARMKEAIV